MMVVFLCCTCRKKKKLMDFLLRGSDALSFAGKKVNLLLYQSAFNLLVHEVKA